jgi:hypothetical protein
MKTGRREMIGSFTAVNGNQMLQKIIVSQEIISHYSGDTVHKKFLSLEALNGPEVYKTDDPNVFKLIDGTTLRKKSR